MLQIISATVQNGGHTFQFTCPVQYVAWEETTGILTCFREPLPILTINEEGKEAPDTGKMMFDDVLEFRVSSLYGDGLMAWHKE